MNSSSHKHSTCPRVCLSLHSCLILKHLTPASDPPPHFLLLHGQNSALFSHAEFMGEVLGHCRYTSFPHRQSLLQWKTRLCLYPLQWKGVSVLVAPMPLTSRKESHSVVRFQNWSFYFATESVLSNSAGDKGCLLVMLIFSCYIAMFQW